MDFPQLLTESEAEDWLGVPIETVALWAREGKLLAAARTEGGQLLFYRWRIERDGAALAAFAPIQTGHSRGKRVSTQPPTSWPAAVDSPLRPAACVAPARPYSPQPRSRRGSPLQRPKTSFWIASHRFAAMRWRGTSLARH